MRSPAMMSNVWVFVEFSSARAFAAVAIVGHCQYIHITLGYIDFSLLASPGPAFVLPPPATCHATLLLALKRNIAFCNRHVNASTPLWMHYTLPPNLSQHMHNVCPSPSPKRTYRDPQNGHRPLSSLKALTPSCPQDGVSSSANPLHATYLPEVFRLSMSL